MTGSSLKCEDPNIPDSTLPSALVQMSSAHRMTGFPGMICGAALCQLLALLLGARACFIVSGTSPRGPLHLHTDPGDRTGGHFERKDLCQTRACAEAATQWGCPSGPAIPTPAWCDPVHCTPAELAPASARQPWRGCPNRCPSTSASEITGISEDRGPWRPWTAAPHPIALPSLRGTGGSKHHAMVNER